MIDTPFNYDELDELLRGNGCIWCEHPTLHDLATISVRAFLGDGKCRFFVVAGQLYGSA